MVHGEYTGQLKLKAEIEEKLGIECIIPELEDSYTIDDDKQCIKDKFNLKYVSARFEVLELLSDLKLDVDDMTNVIKGQLKHNVDLSFDE